MLVSCGKKVPQLNENNIDEVVAAMTTEEKVALVVGIGMDSGSEGYSAVVGNNADRVPGAAGATHSIARLGIPGTILADGPAGLRINSTRQDDENTYFCTHFPIGTLLAATWNQQLVEEVGEAIGNEVLEYGCDVLLAPAENIHRNPMNGRNFEYYSEDPLLSGKTAAAYVRGVQKNGVGTSVKHFAYNNQETNRTGNNVIVSPRAQREIYLKGFEITVKESQPWTIMSSYNLSNGIYTSENPELLEDVLRKDWGYEGIVMTDWYGGKDAVAQMHAGNDMLQPGRPTQFTDIVEGVEDGSLSMEDLNRNVKRILEYIVRTPSFKGYRYSNKPDLEAHAQVTRESAVEGMVLLENNGVLPLGEQVKKTAVFGICSYEFIAGGTGSGNVNRAYTVSLLDGLKNAGFTPDEQLAAKYTMHIQQEREAETERLKQMGEGAQMMANILPPSLPQELTFTDSYVQGLVKTNDAAIITIGRVSGEFLDRKVTDFSLSKEEQQMIKAVSRLFRAAGKPCIVVLNVGGVIETASWKHQPDAILVAWQAGQEGGNSVADVLTGKVNPSGKLPMTWPVALEDHASSHTFPKAENFSLDFSTFIGLEPEEKEPVETYDWTNYEEGIYVGYRWFDKQKKAVSYPFGYGLSYTSFEYSDAIIANDGEYLNISFNVRNNGCVAGKEIVELYVSAPGKDMDKPAQELKAFAKTNCLQPSESQTVSLSINIRDLASYSEATAEWVVEPGLYTLSIGASSRDIRCSLQTEVAATSWKVSDVLHRQTTDPWIKQVKKVHKEPLLTDAAAFGEYYGEWELEANGLPIGDMTFGMTVKETDETAKVTLSMMKVMKMEIEKVGVRGGKLELRFDYSGMPIMIELEKESDDMLKGKIAGSFAVTGKRK